MHHVRANVMKYDLCFHPLHFIPHTHENCLVLCKVDQFLDTCYGSCLLFGLECQEYWLHVSYKFWERVFCNHSLTYDRGQIIIDHTDHRKQIFVKIFPAPMGRNNNIRAITAGSGCFVVCRGLVCPYSWQAYRLTLDFFPLIACYSPKLHFVSSTYIASVVTATLFHKRMDWDCWRDYQRLRGDLGPLQWVTSRLVFTFQCNYTCFVFPGCCGRAVNKTF